MDKQYTYDPLNDMTLSTIDEAKGLMDSLDQNSFDRGQKLCLFRSVRRDLEEYYLSCFLVNDRRYKDISRKITSLNLAIICLVKHGITEDLTMPYFLCYVYEPHKARRTHA